MSCASGKHCVENAEVGMGAVTAAGVESGVPPDAEGAHPAARGLSIENTTRAQGTFCLTVAESDFG